MNQNWLLTDLISSWCMEEVRWQSLLLTAGMDGVLKLFDLRKPAASCPLYQFCGHVDEGVKKVNLYRFVSSLLGLTA